MKPVSKMAALAFAFVFALTSCNTSATTEEKAEIDQMDSTSKVVKDSTERLEEQTKKVEDALEKLENEFDSTQ